MKIKSLGISLVTLSILIVGCAVKPDMTKERKPKSSSIKVEDMERIGMEQYNQRNFKKAINLFNKACYKGNDKKACHSLGFMYMKGKGTSINYEKAVNAFTISCESGLTGSCTNMGNIFAKGGYGVYKNEDKALEI